MFVFLDWGKKGIAQEEAFGWKTGSVSIEQLWTEDERKIFDLDVVWENISSTEDV